MPDLTWNDTDEIGYQLSENHPDVNPLSVGFTDLRDWVVELAEFGDDPKGCSEGKLEEIQMAWLEYYQEG